MLNENHLWIFDNYFGFQCKCNESSMVVNVAIYFKVNMNFQSAVGCAFKISIKYLVNIFINTKSTTFIQQDMLYMFLCNCFFFHVIAHIFKSFYCLSVLDLIHIY